MDGYTGSDDIFEKLSYVCRSASSVNLHQSAVMELLRQSKKEIEELRRSESFHKRRCELLQTVQSKMRDPERTIVCDILANGLLLSSNYDGNRYAIPDSSTDLDIANVKLQRVRDGLNTIVVANGWWDAPSLARELIKEIDK